jgi:hypothetical protein
MNIFVLSKSLKRCARYHADKHLVKMILESAQLLCSAHIVLDNVIMINDVKLYRLTHKNHPCAIWTRASSSNYEWLYKLFCELCKEYTFRYGKIHLTETKLKCALSFVPINAPNGPVTDFALAMPDSCKTADPIESYRNYYKSHKSHLFKWTKRDVPKWIISSI